MNRILKFDAKQQRVWFVSDLHYCHGKPFILEPRQYATVVEAKLDLLDKWTRYIGPQDIVFNLGDVVVGAGAGIETAMRELLALPCAHHYVLWGNHNAGISDYYQEAKTRLGYPEDVEVYPLILPGFNFTFLGDYAEIVIDGQTAILCHYPIASWNHAGKGAFMLHGHCHGNLKDDPGLKRLDVGWDWRKRPVEWSEIVRELAPRQARPVDHHGR